jgi:hypothetical protein
MFCTEQQQSASIKPKTTSNGSTWYRIGSSRTCGRMVRKAVRWVVVVWPRRRGGLRNGKWGRSLGLLYDWMASCVGVLWTGLHGSMGGSSCAWGVSTATYSCQRSLGLLYDWMARCVGVLWTGQHEALLCTAASWVCFFVLTIIKERKFGGLKEVSCRLKYSAWWQSLRAGIMV